MNDSLLSQRGFIKPLAIFVVSAAAIAVCIMFFGAAVRRSVREYLMQSVTSAHYEILCPPGALTQDAMEEFAKQRETLFTALDKKMGDAGSNSEIRIVLDPNFPAPISDETGQLPYSVSGTTIRTKLLHRNPLLPAAADAQALLYVAWGRPGSPEIARWTAIWLLGEWRGSEIGMAAAQVEQRLGHQPLENAAGESGRRNRFSQRPLAAGLGMDQRNRRIWRHARGSQTLRREDVASQHHRRGRGLGYHAAGTEPQMANVDVRVPRRNARDAEQRRHADGYANGEVSREVAGCRLQVAGCRLQVAGCR